MLYPLNLYSDECQLFLNKTGGNKRKATDWKMIFVMLIIEEGLVSKIFF